MTMPDIRAVMSIILQAVDTLNQDLPVERRLDLSPKTVIFGTQGNLDSLELVNLIVIVEEKMADEYGKQIALASERAMSQKSSPFRTIQTLADYTTQLLNEDQNA